MRINVGVLLLSCLPFGALAASAVDIVSPAPGACVNNGGVLFGGGVFGGQAAPPINPVDLLLRITEDDGSGDADVVALTFEIDGELAFESFYFPQVEGVPEETDLYALGIIDDGLSRTLVVRLTQDDFTMEDSVTFRLDRVAPQVTANGMPDAPNPLECFPNPPAVGYDVDDAQDPNPTSSEVIEQDGCVVRRVIRVTDNCGNAQEVSVNTRRPPVPDSISISFDGVAEGGRVGTAILDYLVTQPGAGGCLTSVDATLQRNADVAQVLIPGQPIDQPGDYVARVAVSSCGGEPITASRRFTVLSKPEADAGGPYHIIQGEVAILDASGSTAAPELGGIVAYAWDINNDGYYDPFEGQTRLAEFDGATGDGVYPIRVRIEAGNGTVAVGETTVTVDDIDPLCVLIGPAMASPEGEAVAFDATGTMPGHESDPLLVFNWDFGDNFPQRSPNLFRPFHIFDSAGEYLVRMRVEDVDSSCEASVLVRITDLSPVIEEVTAFGADSLFEGEPVQFSALARPGSFSDPILSYTWDFGDGTPAESGEALLAPRHTYSSQGHFEVCLTIEDPDTALTACIEIDIADLSPEAEITGPGVAIEGDTLAFGAGNTRAGGPADPLRELEWSFGDGSAAVRTGPGVRTLEHLFIDDGNLTISLTARDEDSSAASSRQIVVFDVSPVAAFEVTYPNGAAPAPEGVSVSLDGTLSAPGHVVDAIRFYRWDFGDGSTGEGPTVSHAFPDDGRFTVRLTVEDEDGSTASAEEIVSVENVAPEVTLELDDPQVEIGVETAFTARVADVEGDLPLVRWAMGDGTILEGLTVRHTYRRLGHVVIRVDVDDGDGGTDSVETELEITRALPIVLLPATASAAEGRELLLEFAVNSAPQDAGGFDGPVQIPRPNLPRGAEWEVIDGPNPLAQKLVRIRWTPSFLDGGDRTISVRATAPSGLQRERRVVITVAEGGTPFAAAATLLNGRGRITLIEYGRDPLSGNVTFNAVSDVETGHGLGAMVASPDGRYLFVAAPSSGGVSVVDLKARPARTVRLIQTGPECTGLAFAVGLDGEPDRLYAVNAGDNTLSIIDPYRLKVRRTVSLAPLVKPIDVAYIPGDVDGLGAGRLAIVSARSGHVALVDPALAERGLPGHIVAQHRIGGVLSRVVVDEDNGFLHIADTKARRLYRVSASALLAPNLGANLESTSLRFAATDLAVTSVGLWAATGGGLTQWGPIGQASDHTDTFTRAVSAVDSRVFPGGGLLIASGREVKHLDDHLELQLSASGRAGTGRLAAFVTLQ